jgi:hypothetical protein
VYYPPSGRPLCEHELRFLRQGNILVRHTSRYPLIIMWLTS